ncbi:transketolase [Rhizobium sp. NLR17b]|uniref:transketolase n=1 Tax=Rhizobium sp. NLR17b TaxID=2731114 RepID=UPI001C83808A|nr:transketolase [Rhizobium sp. NLR17b]MBX5272670.1 transketolase [Rhizobium sp. NLR17b]
MSDPTTSIDTRLSNAVRFLSIDAIEEAKSGHPGLPLGAADIATALFLHHLKFDASDPHWPDRDRFVLSAGHGSMLLYSLLHLTGYEDMPLDQLKRLRKLGSSTAGHPEFGHAAGIEATTGPLGQGFAMGVGMALAERMMNARFGDSLVDHHTYVLVGDGCLMEGVAQEAITFAGHLGLNKLIVLFDDNGISIDGPTSMATSEDHLARFEAAGWSVESVNGHDIKAVSGAIARAKKSKRPTFLACKTTIGYGAPSKAGSAKAHSSPLGTDEADGARKQLDWPFGKFEVPAPILETWRKAGQRSRPLHEEWIRRLDQAPQAVRRSFESFLSGPDERIWAASLTKLKARMLTEARNEPTRKSAGEVVATLGAVVPQLVGGSADLSEAVYSQSPHLASITPGQFEGRHIHFGIREHAMAAIMNGISLHGGFVPFGGTFLAFTDYMRGAMRLSALMARQIIYVLTHDSIGLGEDGPTHQPVETLSGLRALPNFKLYRPCDAIEALECWELAMRDQSGPSGLALSRQAVPAIRKDGLQENYSARGGYLLSKATRPRPDVTLVATGSEVALALRVQEILKKLGTEASVVSMPCWELFDAQPSTYQQSVLPQEVLTVAIEAGVRHGWDKYIGRNGLFFGMSSFGGSAPAEELYELFGITVEKIVAAIRDRTGKSTTWHAESRSVENVL